MKTNELAARALDYWCTRAFVDADEEVIFTELEPVLVVTFAHGDVRRLQQRFSPSADWGDAGLLLDRASHLEWTVQAGGTVACRARFAGLDTAGEATGATARLALARAFVRARFGQEVDDDYPKTPHAVRDNRATPYEAGAPVPTYGDVVRSDDEIGDIRSVPRP
jgi:hypothetical protein